MRRIMLTGASGFLGGNFCHFYGAGHEIHAIYHRHPVSYEGVRVYRCDLGDEKEVGSLIEKVQPDVIIHLAALSQPNDCERNPELSKSVNVDVTVSLAMLARTSGIDFLFASTDLVFDGERAPYGEEEIPQPANLYGVQKLEAENRVKELYPKAFICRLPLLYGNTYSPGKSFIQPFLDALQNSKPLNLFTDEFRTVSSARDVCRGLITVLEKGSPGIYHLGGPERLSRMEMGERLCEVFGFDKNLLRSSLRSDVTMPAYRPKDTSLISDKMKKLGWVAGKMKDELKQLKIQN